MRMKTLMRVFLVALALAALAGISVGDASAQWNYYGVLADGGISGHPVGPTGYYRNSLAWGRLGWNADKWYGIGLGGGVGPNSSGNIGIKFPGMQQYNLKWW
jgi:hypothetical protein